MSKKDIKIILVNLDTLLDVRLGTLLKINPDFAFSVTSKDDYYVRVEDKFQDEKFGVLDKNLFEQVMKTFKEEIIRTSLRTRMCEFILELCNKLILSAIDSPYLAGVEIHLNMNPYNFTQEETTKLNNVIKLQLGNQYQVTPVNLSNEQLTCEYVSNTYSALFMYDYCTWLNMHNDKLKSRLLKNIYLYAPKLNYIRPLTVEERAELNGKDEFELIKIILCEFIDMQYLPISLYSAYTPLNC